MFDALARFIDTAAAKESLREVKKKYQQTHLQCTLRYRDFDPEKENYAANEEEHQRRHESGQKGILEMSMVRSIHCRNSEK